MLEIEERLFDEYKRVDRICCDMFSEQQGISRYIAEMEKNSFYGPSAVPSWNRDYRCLKRMRWLRNQIAHETSAADCGVEDATWLEEFHIRLLDRRDPLAQLRQADREQSRSPSHRQNIPPACAKQKTEENLQSKKREEMPRKSTVLIWLSAAAAILILFHWMTAM